MENEPGTSMEVDNNSAAIASGRTKSLKFIPKFSYKKLEEHLVLDGGKTPDGKPVGAFKHKKSGYKLYKAGYPRQFKVRPNVRKQLKTGLGEAGSSCNLIGILGDTCCKPCEFNVNELPSRQRIMRAVKVGDKLETTEIRSSILKRLDMALDYACIPGEEN